MDKGVSDYDQYTRSFDNLEMNPQNLPTNQSGLFSDFHVVKMIKGNKCDCQCRCMPPEGKFQSVLSTTLEPKISLPFSPVKKTSPDSSEVSAFCNFFLNILLQFEQTATSAKDLVPETTIKSEEPSEVTILYFFSEKPRLFSDWTAKTERQRSQQQVFLKWSRGSSQEIWHWWWTCHQTCLPHDRRQTPEAPITNFQIRSRKPGVSEEGEGNRRDPEAPRSIWEDTDFRRWYPSESDEESSCDNGRD